MTLVDAWLTARLVPADPALDAALRASEAAGLPPHQVSRAQGAMLTVLARAMRARSILEIGTLGAYSTICLARGLAPGGRVVTLEASAHHAEVARANLRGAGAHDAVELIVGPALDTLPRLEARGEQAFDLVFIDADKQSNTEYLRWALRLSRVGALVVVDNVVRGGAILDADTADASARGVQRMCEAIAAEPRLAATAIQTVGEKGWDGFVLATIVA